MFRRTRKNPLTTFKDFATGTTIADATVMHIESLQPQSIAGDTPGTVRYQIGDAVGPEFPAVLGLWEGIADKPFPLDDSETALSLTTGDVNDRFPWGDVRRYGAVSAGDPTATTLAIQRAIDVAAQSPNKGRVWLPAGDFYITQIVMKRGVSLYGAGVGGFGTINTMQGSRLRQISDQNKSAIVYDDAVQSNGRTYAGPAAMCNFEVALVGTSTTGYGIDFTTPDGRACSAQDTLLLHNILIRGFPSGGMNLPGGAFPLRLSLINPLYNGGPGIRYVKGGGSTQAVHFDNISGDGNVGGLVYIDNGGIDVGQFLFTNLKSERRVNATYGNAAAQHNAIVLVDCPAPVTIVSANHYSSVGDGVVPPPLIKSSGSTPRIKWQGITVAVQSGDTGTALVLRDDLNSVDIPALVRDGSYANLVDTRYISGASQGRWRHGVAGSVHPSTATHVIGVSGPTPGQFWWETDADADEKLWSIMASGGDLSIRTHTDAGGAGALALVLTRNGTAVTQATFSGTVNALGLEASAASAGLILKSSNGTRWRVTISNEGVLSTTAL